MKLGTKVYFLNQTTGRIYKGKLLEHEIDIQSGYEMCSIKYKSEVFTVERSLTFDNYKDAFITRKVVIGHIREAKLVRKVYNKEIQRISAQKLEAMIPFDEEMKDYATDVNKVFAELRVQVIGEPTFKNI